MASIKLCMLSKMTVSKTTYSGDAVDSSSRIVKVYVPTAEMAEKMPFESFVLVNKFSQRLTESGVNINIHADSKVF